MASVVLILRSSYGELGEIISRRLGSSVLNLSFCLGVRSPCRMNATTQSSSPAASPRAPSPSPSPSSSLSSSEPPMLEPLLVFCGSTNCASAVGSSKTSLVDEMRSPPPSVKSALAVLLLSKLRGSRFSER